MKQSLELFVWGRHPVAEAFGSKYSRPHDFYVVNSSAERYSDLLQVAQKKGISIQRVSRDFLARKIEQEKHQDIAARISLDLWESFAHWSESLEGNKTLTLLAVDGIEDPQNLGTLIRSAHFFGASALIVTKDRSAPITGTVVKASAGALLSLPIIRAVNLARELKTCQEYGAVVVGLDAEASTPLATLAIGDRHLTLVIGSEGEGLRELTKKRCDQLMKLPGGGRDSLNAAIAGSIALYEIFQQRRT